MTDPCVSSQAFDLAVIAAVLAGLLLGAACLLCVHIRNAVLGARLMKACAGDYETAAKALDNVRRENEALLDAMARGFSARTRHEGKR